MDADDRANPIKVMVPITMCSMAVGADRILESVEETIREYELRDVVVVATGCINGLCSAEPVLKICVPGMPDIIYGYMDEKKVRTVMLMHILGKRIMRDWVIEEVYYSAK